MATFKIQAEGNTTYYKDMFDFINQELADRSVVTLLADETKFGWGVSGDYTLDLNGNDLTTAVYSIFAGLAGESETSEISIVNSADERSTVPYIRVNNCTLKIGGKVDVAKMILFYTTCTVDLTNADFSSCELNLNLDGCNTSQFFLGNYAIYDASGNVVTGVLTKGATYTIKAAQ